MNAEGQLKDIDFIDLLVGLWREKFTGAVRAENDAIIKIIYYRAGDLLSASTNDRGDSLGEILLRSGKIGREHLKQGMARRKDEESLGDALLGLGFITRRELTWGRRTQLVGAIRSVVEWKGGEYNIIQDYVPRRDEGPPFPFPQVLLEVILTRTDRERVDRELELGSLVLEPRPEFMEIYPQLNLNDEADGIVRLIDGRRSAVRVAVGSDADRFNVFKLLLALKRLGLIGVVGEDSQPEPEPPIAAIEEPPFIEQDEAMLDTSDEWALADELEPPTPAIVESSSEDHAATAEISEPELPAVVEQKAVVPPPAPSAQEPSHRRAWSIGVLLVAGVAILAAVVYFARVFKPLAQSTVVTEGPRATPSKPLATAAATPPPIVIEATPDVAPITIPSPNVLPTPLAVSDASPSPSPTALPPVPRPSPSPTQIIIARLSTPTPSPASASTAEESGDPLRARYDAMADQFAANISAHYAVQFGIFCRTESITNALAAGGDNVWFVPAIFRGQRCYRAYWGRYAERADAEAALGLLPATLREGTRPSVTQLSR